MIKHSIQQEGMVTFFDRFVGLAGPTRTDGFMQKN
jgi:hypothetical protein